MKVSIQNLGVLKEAEFEIGDLTIICGKNNTGKTYLTHATYGFLMFLKQTPYPVQEKTVDALTQGESSTIDISQCRENLNSLLKSASEYYAQSIARIFAGSENQFSDAIINFHPDLDKEFITFPDIQNNIRLAKGFEVDIQTSSDGSSLELSSTMSSNSEEQPNRERVKSFIRRRVGRAFYNNFPRSYIASTERTGVTVFQRELDFTKNRLWEEAEENGSNSNFSLSALREEFGGIYPLATSRNIDYLRDWADVAQNESQLSKTHPDTISFFSSIIGGDLRSSNDGLISFSPETDKDTRLTLLESSSTVRSLLHVNLYLRHHARPGDLLIIDEPELNLHPENQCKMARLFARLVNAGVKVFISTHSDYIIKELNTLIMLKDDKGRFNKFAKKEGYDVENELLMPDQVRAYMTTPMKGKSTAGKNQTLVPMKITSDRGIRADSFNETIINMNRIQKEIIWGDHS